MPEQLPLTSYAMATDELPRKRLVPGDAEIAAAVRKVEDALIKPAVSRARQARQQRLLAAYYRPRR